MSAFTVLFIVANMWGCTAMLTDGRKSLLSALAAGISMFFAFGAVI